MALTQEKIEILYPESDGKPMAETDVHRKLIVYLIEALTAYFQNMSNVYVTGNLLVYYQPDAPQKNVAPDVFVVFGVPQKDRRVYKIWEEGKTPAVVFEITSKRTARKDIKTKHRLYEKLGVQEYFLIDPLMEYLPEPLVGFRLIEGGYVPIPVDRERGEIWRTKSLTLELEIVVQKEGEACSVRLFDPARGEWLLSASEVRQRLQELEVELKRLKQ